MCCQSNYSRREWFLLVSLCGVTFTTGLCASLQAPFYPLEAEKKGATATEYGVVFGVFELVAFISSPLYGKYMSRLGASFVLKCGIVVAGVSTLLFGLLDLITDHWGFIGLSLVVRIIESLGTSAVVTASLSIVVLIFSHSFAKVFAMLEIMQGLGYMVGPTVGGYLFGVGGFMVPFMTVGILVLLNGMIVCISLPRIEDLDGKLRTKVPISAVLKIVPVSLDALCMMVEAMSVGFLAATLEPHLRQFLLSPAAMGAMFIISGAVYTCMSPLIGILCDKQYDTKVMIMLGSTLVIGAFILIGPLPFTHYETSLWMVGPGLVLDGIGMSFIFVPAFVDAIVSSVKYGLPYDISTFSMVSGIYASSFALGAFIGPTVAGILFDSFGFRQATLFVIVVHLLMFLAMLIFTCFEKRYQVKYNVMGVASADATGYGHKEEIMLKDNDSESQALIVIDNHKERRFLQPSTDNLRKINGYNSFQQNNSVVFTHTC